MLMRAGCGLFLALLLLALPGCGAGSTEGPSVPADAKATSPVTGSVTIDGKVPKGLKVYLVPAAAAQPMQIDDEFSSGHTSGIEGEGKFAISTYLRGDGAPPGDYVVVMRWDPRGTDRPSDSVLDSFNWKYGNPAESKLKVTVEAGKPTALEKWELTSK